MSFLAGLDVQVFLETVKQKGHLLPEAPAEARYDPRLIDARRAAVDQPACARCGAPSETAFGAITFAGFRWLDLCMDCSLWMVTGLRHLAGGL